MLVVQLWGGGEGEGRGKENDSFGRIERGVELDWLCLVGTYRVDGFSVKIAGFSQQIDVIASKQRPRKIVLHGSDGRDYMFLLKAHEDLRQDERCMQLFGLVNALLDSEVMTQKHDLGISR
ncbi:MAG: hypothetical protein AAFY15_13030 [Cyanobacteria bacterium J06648_11]